MLGLWDCGDWCGDSGGDGGGDCGGDCGGDGGGDGGGDCNGGSLVVYSRHVTTLCHRLVKGQL